MKKKYLVLISSLVVLAVAVFLVVQAIADYQERQANVVPDPPSALRISNVTSQQVELEWQDEATNELGYGVYRNGSKIDELSKDSTSYIDYTVEPSTIYEYAVVAYNKAGESEKATVRVKSRNPGIVVRLDKIGVRDNGEDLFRDLVNSGEIYIGVIVSDDTNPPQKRRLPAKGFYKLADDDELEIGELIYVTSYVGEYLIISIMGLEHDCMGLGDDLLIEALNYAVTSPMGPLTSAILTVAGADFKKPITEIGGFRDDFLGEYYEHWPASDNWGIGKHYIECDKGDGKIGLRIWFTIKSPMGN